MDVLKVSIYSIFFMYLLFLNSCVISETYRVGDDGGWNSGTGISYLSWSQQYNFSVGDVLVFKYSKVQHNVKEVTDATFRSCNASSGVLATYLSGNDEITLAEARKYNFICDKDNHCLGGMRFFIDVFETSSNSNTTNPTTTTNYSPPPPSSLYKSATFKTRGKLIHNILALGILLVFMF